MVITVKDTDGNIARRGIAPCPDAGSTMPLGVSEMTAKQTTAMLAGFQAAGSDDPILAVFGNTIVRSTGITDSELEQIAIIANQGISGTNGFVDYLKAEGVTDSQLVTYRNAIVARLADANDGYSKIMKDSVDEGFRVSADEERKKRGEAAAKLLSVLVDAAVTAGFDPSLALEAFDAMGVVVMPLFQTAVDSGVITAATMQSVNATVGGGINKLRADKEISSYQEALTTLDASGDDLTQFTNAATALSSAMRTAFQNFEAVFDGNETEAAVQAAQNSMNTAMQTAFNAFTTSVAASDARITALVDELNAILGAGSVSSSDFTFHNENGQANWPIMMVVMTEWLNNAVIANGNDANNTVSYTRDTATIPDNLIWVGSCSDGSSHDKTTCINNSGAWTPGRTDYSALGIPGSYAALFGIQEDIMIREFTRYAEESTADGLTDPAAQMQKWQELEKAYNRALDTIAGNISGTNPDGEAITDAQKKALVRLLKTPQL